MQSDKPSESQKESTQHSKHNQHHKESGLAESLAFILAGPLQSDCSDDQISFRPSASQEDEGPEQVLGVLSFGLLLNKIPQCCFNIRSERGLQRSNDDNVPDVAQLQR